LLFTDLDGTVHAKLFMPLHYTDVLYVVHVLYYKMDFRNELFIVFALFFRRLSSCFGVRKSTGLYKHQE